MPILRTASLQDSRYFPKTKEIEYDYTDHDYSGSRRSSRELCCQGKFEEAAKTFYSPEIVSVEAGAPPGQSRETKGLPAVMAKGEWWVTNHEVHSVKVEGPLVAGSHFAVVFKLDVTFKPQSKRFQMEEVAVYKVADGQIVYEEFFYNM